MAHISLNVQATVFTNGVYPHATEPVGSIFGMIDGISVQLTGTPGNLRYLGDSISALADKLQARMENDNNTPLPTE